MMITKVYYIGVIIGILWFFMASLLAFSERIYENSTEEGKKSIDDMHQTLRNINPENPQLAYFILSMIIVIAWPISIIYFTYNRFFK